LRAPPSAGKFINRWNGPFIITKSYSNINYEIESYPKTKQKPVVVHSNRLKPYTERVPEIPAEIQRERMTQPAKAEEKGRNIAVGAQHQDKSSQCNQPVKRRRGRPRKNDIIPPKPNPTTYPSRRNPTHQNTLRRDSSRRDADFTPNYAHMLPQRDETYRRNYPNTRATRSQARYQQTQYSYDTDSDNICTPVIPKRDAPDIAVTRNGDRRFVYHIPVAKKPYHSYRDNQRQDGTSHRDEHHLPRHRPHDKAYSQQTRYNLRQRF
jgi:hypothetical protein